VRWAGVRGRGDSEADSLAKDCERWFLDHECDTEPTPVKRLLERVFTTIFSFFPEGKRFSQFDGVALIRLFLQYFFSEQICCHNLHTIFFFHTNLSKIS
jgi:hypothetical protein